ncbi:MAG: tyrosine protein phosphatase [Proteobacteria bacterium]|nr:tyrosine protein phosphatase [Pseudomonadota bacterium]MBU1711012.1 tyrosine protein phosphatase [Pseudomonadota bacterium]
MIDIHAHILPGLDDGPSDKADALMIADMAARDGIKIIIATPHIHMDTKITPSLVKTQVAAFNDLLYKEKINISVLAGGEIAFSSSMNTPAGFCLHKGPYLLVEFPHTHLPDSAAEWLYQLQLQGFLPIIAHPERNPAVIRDPGLLIKLLVPGVFAQITAESVTGGFGSQIQQCAHYLLRLGAAHFIATDTHSPDFRKPCLSKARKIAAKIIGKAAAEKLVSDHPAAVIQGENLPDFGG